MLPALTQHLYWVWAPFTSFTEVNSRRIESAKYLGLGAKHVLVEYVPQILQHTTKTTLQICIFKPSSIMTVKIKSHMTSIPMTILPSSLDRCVGLPKTSKETHWHCYNCVAAIYLNLMYMGGSLNRQHWVRWSYWLGDRKGTRLKKPTQYSNSFWPNPK